MRDNPYIAALDIMKEVGRIWQSITKPELEYFKDKSRLDLDRFKKEHTRFINEINELRAKSTSDFSSQQSDKEIQNLDIRTPEIKKRTSQPSQF